MKHAGTLIRTISGINNQDVKSIHIHQDKGIGKGIGKSIGIGKDIGIGKSIGIGKDIGIGKGIGRGMDMSGSHVSVNRQPLISFTQEEHHCLCAYFAAQVREISTSIINYFVHPLLLFFVIII